MRLTQMEFGKFLGAVPSTQATRSQNNASVAQQDNMNNLAQAKAAFFGRWGQVRGSLVGAQPAWLAYKAQAFGPDGSYIPPQNRKQPASAPPGRAAGNAALLAKSGRTQPTLLGYE
jgi:hypothetical protein